MNEQQTVTQQAIGFSYSVTIEKELRTNTAAKYPDKTVLKATLSGHADTHDMAAVGLRDASKTVKKQISELEAIK